MRMAGTLLAALVTVAGCASSPSAPAAPSPCVPLKIAAPITSSPALSATPSAGYSLRTGAKPVGIASSGSEVWIAETGLDRVARLIPRDGSLVEYQLPVSELGFNLAVGPDGVVWTAEQYRDAVAGIAPGGAVHECRLGRGAEPTGVAVAPDGTLWVAEGGAGKVVRLRSGAKAFDTFVMPEQHGKPTELLLTHDGVYVTQLAADYLVHIGLDGAVIQIPLGIGHPQPIGMLEAAGSLWVAEFGGDRVARITNGQVTQLAFPSGSKPQAIVESHGHLLVTGSGANAIFDIDPAANSVRAAFITGGWPDHLVVAEDGTVWYTEWQDGRIARTEAR